MKLKNGLVLGGLASVLMACSSTSQEPAMSQVPSASQEHAINTPLSAAILRQVKDFPAPERARDSGAAEAPRLAAGAASAPAPAAAAASAPALAASAAPVALAASAVAPAASAAVAATSAATAPPAAPVQHWTVEVSDGSLSRALKRWAVKANVPLVWQAPQDKPAFFADYTGTFEEAITKVMAESRKSAYRIHACGHDNVVVILHASQFCER